MRDVFLRACDDAITASEAVEIVKRLQVAQQASVNIPDEDMVMIPCLAGQLSGLILLLMLGMDAMANKGSLLRRPPGITDEEWAEIRQVVRDGGYGHLVEEVQ
jgi:hypothetical protein